MSVPFTASCDSKQIMDANATQTKKIYVAVGNDPQDGFKTLNWALKKWNSHPISIVILYVTQNISLDYVYTPCKFTLVTFVYIEIQFSLAYFCEEYHVLQLENFQQDL